MYVLNQNLKYRVLDKAGEEKDLERYDLVSNSEIKAEKEHLDHEVKYRGLGCTASGALNNFHPKSFESESFLKVKVFRKWKFLDSESFLESFWWFF